MYIYVKSYHTAFVTVHSWLGKRKMWHSRSLVEHYTDSRNGVWPVCRGKPHIETGSRARVIAKIQLFLHPRERIVSIHKVDAATGWVISIYRTKQFSHHILGNSKHIQLSAVQYLLLHVIVSASKRKGTVPCMLQICGKFPFVKIGKYKIYCMQPNRLNYIQKHIAQKGRRRTKYKVDMLPGYRGLAICKFVLFFQLQGNMADLQRWPASQVLL
jgi:hypothetical protein